jgi:flagellin
MVGSVNTNVNAMAAIATLNSIGNQMTQTQSAIQSGLKVATASDSPAVFTIAQGLRGNLLSLSAVSQNLATGTATLQAQTQGATSIYNALNTLLQTVTTGAGSTGAALTAVNATITNALANVNAYASEATINGTNLLNTAGTFSVVSNITGTTTTLTTTAASTAAGLGLTALATTLTSSGASTLSAPVSLNFKVASAAGDGFAYTSATGVTTNYTFAANAGSAGSNVIADGAVGVSATNVAAAINATYQAATGNYAATNTIATVGATSIVVLAGGGSLASSNSGNLVSGGPASADVVQFVDNAGTTAVTQTYTFGSGVGQVALGGSAAASYQNLAAAMIANGVSASVSNGVLNISTPGTLTIPTNSGGATAVTGGTSNATTVITNLTAALATVGATLSNLGAVTKELQGLSDFTDQLSTSVTTALGAMVDANLSQESAQLSSLQTKQSLAIQSLSLANQGPGALLQLFR